MSMEKKISHSTHSDDCVNGVARSFRNLPPAHYTINIDSFSNLKKQLSGTGAKSYKSKTFKACGYKWKLSLYPNGDEQRNGMGYISMYLAIQDTEALPLDWKAYVNFKFFVLDQIRGKYLTVQEDGVGKVRCFDKLKMEWGFPQLLPQDVFHDPNNGYLIHDECMFGAEVLVISQTGKGEFLTYSCLDDVNGRYTWKISSFSALPDEVHCSDIFTLGNFKWQLRLYPKGDSSEADGDSLSIFLMLVELKTSDNADVEYTLSIKNQCDKEDKEGKVHHLFTSSGEFCGFDEFLSLKDLKDTSKGYLVNDSLIIEVQITKISAQLSFS